MPSQPYNLVKDDHENPDLRIPLHADQAYFQGIRFQAKLIGWQEVPRPSTRGEIVAAMRRIRYESKVQNTKKTKVMIEISIDGVRVCLKKKKRKKKQYQNDPSDMVLMNHPIYRIFYVSHDSQDLKIFSYIARDSGSDTFKCSVFKTNSKSQAMRIVRTVGQAFEVCHKLSMDNNSYTDDRSSTSEHERCSPEQLSDLDEIKKDPIPVTPEPQLQRPNHLDIIPTTHFSFNPPSTPSKKNDGGEKTPDTPTSREIKQLKDQLDQHALQARQALAQLMMCREQLLTETNARIEAQARIQQLMQQNRELLEAIAQMGGYHESDRQGLTSGNIGLAPQLSSSAKVARWFNQIQWNNPPPLSRPESGFVSGDSRSEKNDKQLKSGFDAVDCHSAKDQTEMPTTEEFADEYLLVAGSASLWSKLNVKKRKKLLKLGKVTTF